MKKTKIICTLGPSSSDLKTITNLIKNGMNVARINMSHGSYETHKQLIDNVKQARKDLNQSIAIMVDTKGPEIRIGNFEKNEVLLKEKQKFIFTIKEVLGNENIVSVTYKKLNKCLKKNDKIYANNGMLVFKVTDVDDFNIYTKVMFGGKLSNKKSLNIPNIVPDTNFISEIDKKDLLFAIENKCEYIAASFVSSSNNVLELRKFLDDNNGKDIKIICKIENMDGVNNIEEIINLSDGTMVARGDLGVEIPLTKLPAIQKRIINICNKYSKIVIVATEMLESMITNIRPTRAEVSDVANSIFDLTSATMLSGETAAGKNPLLATKCMKEIILEAEKTTKYNIDYPTINKYDIKAKQLINGFSSKIKNIAMFTDNDYLIKSLSKYHIKQNIFAFTDNERLYHSMSLIYNVTPIFYQHLNNDELYEYAEKIMKGKIKNNNFNIYFEKN